MATDRQPEIVILGAGLAGLSTAYHLQQAGIASRIYEREDVAGGLCRSFQRDGFTFDCTGHLIHFRRPEIKALVERLMAGMLVPHHRRAAIYSHRVFTDYPFQANTFGLPVEVVKECVMGFVEAWAARTYQRRGRSAGRARRSGASSARTFHDWVVETFGPGIAKHFMVPFNEKLWQRPLSQLSCDWGGGWLIPVPTLEEVVQGALGMTNRRMGYNPSFFYPREGGIQRYPMAFAERLKEIHYRHEVVTVDVRARTVECQNGARVHYDRLISTIPLPELVRRLSRVRSAIRQSVKRLRHVSVTNVVLGVDRPTLSPYHWVYFPEKHFRFYRVGFPSNLTPSVAPSGQSLVSVELSHVPSERVDRERVIQQAIDGLRDCGILRRDDRITMQEVLDIPYAYVIFDHARDRELATILRGLREHGIESIGRYGAWEHSSMEEAVWQGKCSAEAIIAAGKRRGRAKKVGRRRTASRR